MSLWVQALPAGWVEAPLKTRLSRNDGGVWGDDPDGISDTIVLRSTEQKVDGTWSIDEPAFRKLTASEISGSLLEVGDLLLTKSSGSELHIGKTSLVNEEVAALGACYSNFMQRLRVDARTEPRFVHYWLNNTLCREQFAYLSNSTSGLANLSAGLIKCTVLAFPGQADQQRIANFLDDKTARIDALIAEKELLVGRIAELRHSEFSHILTCGLRQGAATYSTGHPAIPELPIGWKLSRLKWVCSLLRDGTHTPPPRVDVGVPLLSVRNVQNGEFSFLPDDSLISEPDYLELNRSFEVRQGDVLLAVVGATMGKVAEVREMGRPFQIQRSLAILRPKTSEIGSTLLAATIRAEYFQTLLWQNTGFSAQPGTYLGALADFPIPVPPPEEQDKIVAHMSRKSHDFDKLTEHTVEHISRLREYRSSLISAAVTGQLDVDVFKAAE